MAPGYGRRILPLGPARGSDGSYAGVEDGRDDGVEAESGVHEPSACVRGLEFCYYSLAWC